MKKQGRVTLGDVAVRAGVSVSTASLVLANKARERNISTEVHIRVQQAAAELDYCPNLLVRSIQRGRTHVLSFFNGYRDRQANDLYMERLSTAIERAAGSIGYDILVTCDYSRPTEETYRLLNGGRADGLLLFAPKMDDPLLAYLRGSRLPVVLIHGQDDRGALPCVRDHMDDGMRQVADRLLELGHRRVAAITDSLGWNPEAPRRIGALRQLLRERGIAIPDHWVVPVNSRQPDEVTHALIRLRAEAVPPTALFCWHDRVGYVVLERCIALGIEVPQQLSLIGYDGLRWPTINDQILDSVYVDFDVLAATAVRALDDLINGKEVVTDQQIRLRLAPGSTLCPAYSA